ncbi:MAG: MFS transporter [Anaerocolumna sp.]
MKLNYKQTFFISLAFMSICAFWQLYDNIIPLILANTFHLKETPTGVIMALDNVLALFLLPLFGAFSDKVHTRIGKRIPFILVGTILSTILMIFLPIADRNENFLLYIIVLGILLISMGSYRSPAVALMPDVTPKALRSSANAIINLMGTLGAIFTLIMVRLLIPKVSKPDYTNVFMAVAIFMLVCIGILLITIRENKLSSTVLLEQERKESNGSIESSAHNKLPKNVMRSLVYLLVSVFLWFTAYNAITTAYSRYAAKVWGLQGGSFADTLLVATGAATISYIPIGIISSKIGRKKTILAGIILITISYFLGFLFVSFSPIIYGVFALTGIGWAAINVNSYPMAVDMSKGFDVGKYTGLYYIFSMSAQIITPILSGIFLENISYKTLFPYSVFFSVLSFCTMLKVAHGDIKPSKKKSMLENFDIDD